MLSQDHDQDQGRDQDQDRGHQGDHGQSHGRVQNPDLVQSKFHPHEKLIFLQVPHLLLTSL